MQLKISEEKALLCGATYEYNKLLIDKSINHNELLESFESERQQILNDQNLTQNLKTKRPPNNYGRIILKGYNISDYLSIYGSPKVIVYASTSYWLDIISVTKTNTGASKTFRLYSSPLNCYRRTNIPTRHLL